MTEKVHELRMHRWKACLFLLSCIAVLLVSVFGFQTVNPDAIVRGRPIGVSGAFYFKLVFSFGICLSSAISIYGIILIIRGGAIIRFEENFLEIVRVIGDVKIPKAAINSIQLGLLNNSRVWRVRIMHETDGKPSRVGAGGFTLTDLKARELESIFRGHLPNVEVKADR